jgi:hypothetical protein
VIEDSLGKNSGLKLRRKSARINKERKARKMMVTRKFVFISLLAVAALLVQNASATLIGSLPDTSYLDGQWYGSLIYEDEGFNVLIEYAVYDTLGGYEIAGIDGYQAPGQGRYIYAYQIFQHQAEGYEDVAYFRILDIDENPISEALMQGTTALDDGAGGIAPTPLISQTQGVWTWGGSEDGYISTSEHSWLLVFSSNSEPVAGKYEIKNPSDDIPAPIPDPATLTLLGAGSAILFKRRRRFI